MRRLREGWTEVRRWLPDGSQLTHAGWERRHRAITAVMWAHLPALLALAVLRGESANWTHVGAEFAVLGVLGVVATTRLVGRRWRTAAGVLALVGCSALLVHLTDGIIESHFHYFAVVAFIALYQEWFPFLLALGYVVVQHAVVGVLIPTAVYNHPAAWNRPFTWALVHGGFVLLAAAANIAAWRLSEDARRHAERVLDASGDGLYGVDTEGRIVFANPVAAELVGRTPEALIGLRHHEALGHCPPQGMPDSVACRVCDVAANPTSQYVAEATFTCADERTTPVEYIVRPMMERGRRVGAVVSFRDISERKALEAELMQQALHDPLTGLANRALLLDHLSLALARMARRGGNVALFFCDLDRFKIVNDSLGHTAGDVVLEKVAERLRSLVRGIDTVARLGGDEFAMVYEDLSDAGEAFAIAQRIIEALQAPFDIDGTEAFIGTSVGVCVTSDPAATPEAMLRDADVALYRAKQQGKGRAVLFDESLRDHAIARFETETELHRALERDELVLHYQPKVALEGLDIIGIEALVRWNHPKRGMVPPNEFIPVAEETGLIIPIGQWVLEQACAQLDRWQKSLGPDRRLMLAVNLSGRQLVHQRLHSDLTKLLKRHKFDPSQLCLEVTETTLIEDIATSVSVLQQLRGLGVTIAVDDFGTGYSSLNYLRQFPVDVLKIDRSFVSGLGDEGDNRDLVTAIIALARALNLRTTAEGVELGSELEVITQLGCDFAQGYLFARPQPAEELTPLLVAGRALDLLTQAAADA